MLVFVNPSMKKENQVVLRNFVGEVIACYQPQASQQNNVLVNDVGEDLEVMTDRSLLATAVGRLITTVNQKCTGSSIRISAKAFHNVILFRINHEVTRGLDMQDLKEVEAYAATLGGTVTLNNLARHGNAIILSFISLPTAA